MRLVNGSSHCSGRVEVYHEGEWGTVCGTDWEELYTAVVCKVLGCGDAVDTMQYAYFGEGTGRVLLAEVACGGWETSLKACPHKVLGKHTCQPRNSVGIICSGKMLAVVFNYVNNSFQFP